MILNQCVNVCVSATGWRPAQGVPRLSACDNWERLQHPHDPEWDNWDEMDGRACFCQPFKTEEI